MSLCKMQKMSGIRSLNQVHALMEKLHIVLINAKEIMMEHTGFIKLSYRISCTITATEIKILRLRHEKIEPKIF